VSPDTQYPIGRRVQILSLELGMAARDRPLGHSGGFSLCGSMFTTAKGGHMVELVKDISPLSRTAQDALRMHI